MEDYAWVIDYLPIGHASAIKKEPVVQLLGTRFFTLLEATVKPESSVVVGQKVCVGKEGREEVSHIKGRLKYDDLTNSAKDILPNIVKKAVKEREKEFVDFLNRAKPISIRVHMLDLLPGIGKKTAQKLVIELKEKVAKAYAIKPSDMAVGMGGDEPIVSDAISALISLGYSPREARDAILKSGIDLSSQGVEDIIKQALKSLV